MSKINVSSSLCLIKHHVTKTCDNGGVTPWIPNLSHVALLYGYYWLHYVLRVAGYKIARVLTVSINVSVNVPHKFLLISLFITEKFCCNQELYIIIYLNKKGIIYMQKWPRQCPFGPL
jgi:hypothetical protein